MQSLVELSHEYLTLTRVLDEQGGELTPELETALDVTEGNIVAKVDAIDYFLQSLERDEEFFKKMAERYTNAKRARANLHKHLKERIKLAMHNLDRTELKGASVLFKRSKSKPRLNLDLSVLPIEYYMTVTTKEPDKKRIEENLDKGIQVPGACYEEVFALRTYANNGEK